MLGRHADAFFAKQMRERILANSPNGMAGSIAFPDRELAGTGKVTRVSGHYEMPGPQNVVMGNSMLPGMQGAEMMPGMGYEASMPGMGFLFGDPKILAIGGAVVLGGLLWLRKGKKSSKRRSRRRSRRRRGGAYRDSLGRFAARRA
jgi:hypothetical protein